MNLKKLEMYLQVNLLGPRPSSYKKIIYRAAVSQRLRNTGLEYSSLCAEQKYFMAEFPLCATLALGDVTLTDGRDVI
jgi:hypothetical protein